MTFLQLLVAGLVILFVFCFFGAIAGMWSDGGYHPMSPDEEYQWLTEEHGLTHEEAEEIMRPIPRREG